MNVILYSTKCPRCNVLERKLSSSNIEFRLVEDEDLMIEKGFVESPMMEVDGEIMNFKKAIEWVNKQQEIDNA